MSDHLIRSIAVVGGGTAGWLAAATLARVLRGQASITVIDGGESGDLLAGEAATLPALRALHEILGIDEADLLRRTSGTYRLGTQFEGWNASGGTYFHPLGEIGANVNGTPFRNHWLKLRAAGEVPDYAEFSIAGIAAKAGKFTRPATDKRSVLSTLDYGCHLDAALYTAYIRGLAEKGGVTRIADSVAAVSLDAEAGFVDALILRGGQRVTAELIVDCTGVAMDALGIASDDWSGLLPCDRIASVDSEPLADAPPYSRAIAREAGWQWCMPLRDRTGNGYVYASADETDAEAKLLASLPSAPRGEVRHASFKSGRRRSLRHKNVIAIGPGACMLEPLEGAPLHVIHIGINRLLSLFPDTTHSAIEAAEYDRVTGGELERLRDFLIAHYKTTGRSDTPFWRRCGAIDVPELLERKLVQFESRGRIVLYDEETFGEPSWSAMLIGQRVVPHRVDPYIDSFDVEMLRGQAQRIHSVIRQGAASMPSHKAILERIHGPR